MCLRPSCLSVLGFLADGCVRPAWKGGGGRGTGRDLFVSPPQLLVLDFPDVLQLNICMFGVPVITELASLRYSCLTLQRQDVQVLLNVFLAPDSLGIS